MVVCGCGWWVVQLRVLNEYLSLQFVRAVRASGGQVRAVIMLYLHPVYAWEPTSGQPLTPASPPPSLPALFLFEIIIIIGG